MAEILQFTPRSNVDRHKLAQQAKAIYESIFPTDLAMHHADPEDNGLPNDVAYAAPDEDGA